MTHEHIGNTAMVDAAKGEVPRSTRFQPADRLRGEKRQVMDEEAAPRAINAQPWEPPPGMVKRQCPHCRYFFAAPSTEPEAVLRCPDCAAEGTRPQRFCTSERSEP